MILETLVSKDVEFARDNVADILFTSGAAKAINLAIKGYYLSNVNKENHIITLKTEIKAVLDLLSKEKYNE